MRGRRWKWRAMDAEENEKHVFLRAHSPWKSQKARFPTFPPPRRQRRWKSGNPKAGFPLSHRLDSYLLKTKKEAWRPVATLPAQAHLV